MPEPLELGKVQSLQAALLAIAVAAGFHYTIADMAVKLDPDHEVDELIPSGDRPGQAPRPFVLLDLSARHEFDYAEKTSVLIRLPYQIYWMHETELDDDASRLTTYFRGLADVETAIASDDVRILGRRMLDPDGRDVCAVVDGHITIRRPYGVPNV